MTGNLGEKRWGKRCRGKGEGLAGSRGGSFQYARSPPMCHFTIISFNHTLLIITEPKRCRGKGEGLAGSRGGSFQYLHTEEINTMIILVPPKC